MKKRMLSILSTLLIVVFITTSVGAEGAVKLNSVTFRIGSLIAEGYASGLGRTDVVVELVARGDAVIICTNPGHNDVPGQSSPKISAIGYQAMPGNDPIRKNGRSPFDVETTTQDPVTWDMAGCPNSNWTAHVDFVFWTHATISVYNTNHDLLKQQDYLCTTTREPEDVTCSLVN
jgi:hypothetical protein